MELKRTPDTATSGPLETIRAAKLNGPELSPPNLKHKPCGHACEHCSAVFASSTHGRTKRFCSDRCRQAHRKVASTPGNGLRYRADRAEPKSALQAADLQCESKPEIPSRKTNCHGKWGGYRTTKAIAWVINVGPRAWLARYGDQSCGPSSFPEAKANATAMAKGTPGDYVLENPIRHLNGLQARLLGGDVGAP
jgi:hypothetical protein